MNIRHDRASRLKRDFLPAVPDSAQAHPAAETIPPLPHFASRLVLWQRRHGRHDLPWQVRDPYRVWLSEIMLQQTQVASVIDYYARFTARFPTVQALAAASEDEVLAAWSGLGYYQRARNLQRCAQIVVQEHGGAFPRTAQSLAALPGIGPSTAAAIAAFCFGERAAILDGNVQRVLCRSHGIDAPMPSAAAMRQLRAFALSLLPAAEDISAYTQGLMDLGATVCRPRQPACPACPFAADCRAHLAGDPQRLPLRRAARKIRPQRSAVMLWLRRSPEGLCWLEKRPPLGIWPGLWSLPQFDTPEQALRYAARLGRVIAQRKLPPFRHAFTHFELTIQPLLVDLQVQPGVAEPQGLWIDLEQAARMGLPAPVRRLLTANRGDMNQGLLPKH